MKNFNSSFQGLLIATATSAISLFALTNSAMAFLPLVDTEDTFHVRSILDRDFNGVSHNLSVNSNSFNDVFGNSGDLTITEEKTPTLWEDSTVYADTTVSKFMTFQGKTPTETNLLITNSTVPFDPLKPFNEGLGDFEAKFNPLTLGPILWWWFASSLVLGCITLGFNDRRYRKN
ncbi:MULTISPECIES: hypothetical protein [unclassified Okeania]|uniref:hypothetical protein n=1 Tax=unclassified Okeania TaxID=2634635 RepID=UPI0013B8C246|nr:MULTISPECIES: hypothetical protein [unclassified Okeania]NEP38337.1 hypothetical protein [Okeania sp. SIO2H7]NEP74260.1 hypothetical protein [Okeania sp. SIO2G5]NEP95259.1 hypothetical protein [Okeania sp. SIO2F5]NEQ92982.1 hypothetical protein [Okeania sp. SIO2G4]NES78874.1 hypothetical protein [Okeania sp. SIO1H4]